MLKLACVPSATLREGNKKIAEDERVRILTGEESWRELKC